MSFSVSVLASIELSEEVPMAQRKIRPEGILVELEVGELSEQKREEIRRRFWQAVERIRELNADRDPDEIYREVTEVVEEVRQEQYERTKRDQGGC
jgi:hypothetical protein